MNWIKQWFRTASPEEKGYRVYERILKLHRKAVTDSFIFIGAGYAGYPSYLIIGETAISNLIAYELTLEDNERITVPGSRESVFGFEIIVDTLIKNRLEFICSQSCYRNDVNAIRFVGKIRQA